MAGDVSYAHPLPAWTRRLVDARPPVAWSAALMFLVGGIACLLAARFPLLETPHRPLVMAIGVWGCLEAGAVWVLGRRLPPSVLALLAAGSTLLVSVVIAICATRGSVMTAAFGYALGAAYYSHFFSQRIVHLQSLLVAVCFGLALILDRLPGMAVYWAVVSLSVWVAAWTLNRSTDVLRLRAETDHLTGLLNREGFAAAAEREHALAARTYNPLALAIIDLNGFKQINDSRGHLAGDRLLKKLPTTWQRSARAGDILARHGGDEFVLLMPCTSLSTARKLLEQVYEKGVRVEGRLITCTAGISMWKRGESLEACIAAADRELLRKRRKLAGQPKAGGASG
jgi:diguanylate cyclase (GGDEF)-like protein